MKLIYVAHPFNGEKENVEKVEKIIRRLLTDNPDTVFLSPLHATGFYYHDVPYDVGMEHCLEMLRRCDELWLCEGWENSRGCGIEYSYARGTGIPIREVTKGVLLKLERIEQIGVKEVNEK
jgi:hypothetical protein